MDRYNDRVSRFGVLIRFSRGGEVVSLCCGRNTRHESVKMERCMFVDEKRNSNNVLNKGDVGERLWMQWENNHNAKKRRHKHAASMHVDT